MEYSGLARPGIEKHIKVNLNLHSSVAGGVGISVHLPPPPDSHLKVGGAAVFPGANPRFYCFGL